MRAAKTANYQKTNISKYIIFYESGMGNYLTILLTNTYVFDVKFLCTSVLYQNMFCQILVTFQEVICHQV